LPIRSGWRYQLYATLTVTGAHPDCFGLSPRSGNPRSGAAAAVLAAMPIRKARTTLERRFRAA
jgi:hypothetical protein